MDDRTAQVVCELRHLAHLIEYGQVLGWDWDERFLEGAEAGEARSRQTSITVTRLPDALLYGLTAQPPGR